MTPPKEFRAPERCTDVACKAKKSPAFVQERFNATTGKRQGEFVCDARVGGCGLVHIVNESPAKGRTK